MDNTSVLLKHTFYGDANLDGTVDLQDFNKLAANFGASPRRWSQGDFDFNASVNLQDFNKLAANFGAAGLSPDMLPPVASGASRGASGEEEGGLAELA